jgi:hypothetical protein
MNCETVQDLLIVPAGERSSVVMMLVDAHLKGCQACNEARRAQQLIGASLQTYPTPLMPQGFAERILPRVFAEDAQRHRRRKLAALGLTGMLVFGLILGLTLNAFVSRSPDYAMLDGKLVLQSERPTIVGVAFDAGSALSGVQFTIDLPTGMQMADQPGVRHLSWMGELRKGQNLLKLPVIAHAGTHGLLVAELNKGEEHRTFSLPVLAEEPASFGTRLTQQLTHTFNWQS